MTTAHPCIFKFKFFSPVEIFLGSSVWSWRQWRLFDSSGRLRERAVSSFTGGEKKKVSLTTFWQQTESENDFNELLNENHTTEHPEIRTPRLILQHNNQDAFWFQILKIRPVRLPANTEQQYWWLADKLYLNGLSRNHLIQDTLLSFLYL